MVRIIIFIIALTSIVYNSFETGRSYERCQQLIAQNHHYGEMLKYM